MQRKRGSLNSSSDPYTLMGECRWELYRLSVVEGWPETAYKAAVLAGIRRKLMILTLEEQDSIKLPASPRYDDTD
jgi:hypothetical protein